MMKTIGLIGGMSWESTALYYREINTLVRKQLGGLHSAKIIINSVDFDVIEKLQRKQDWAATAEILKQAARSLELAGADVILIATNTMHIVANEIQEAITVPLLSVVDATAAAIQNKGLTSTLLLGTQFTMEARFYVNTLREHGLKVQVPDLQERQRVHKVIYEELCQGVINNSARDDYITIIEKYAQLGSQSVILGCTEIGLLIKPRHVTLPVFDTTLIHAKAAVMFSLSQNE